MRLASRVLRHVPVTRRTRVGQAGLTSLDENLTAVNDPSSKRESIVVAGQFVATESTCSETPGTVSAPI